MKKEVWSYDYTSLFHLPQRRSAVNLSQKQNYKKEEIRTHLPRGRISSDFLHLVRPTRFERATYRVGVCHSIQLSYGRMGL